MATQRSSGNTGTASKRGPRKPRAAPQQPAPDLAPQPAGGARALLRAGLKALGDVPGDVIARQSRIFELLLGIGQAPAWTAASRNAGKPVAAPDPFGKFEGVFDQRVARSLERLGIPSPRALQELTLQVQELTRQVQALSALLEDTGPPRRRKR